MAKPARCRTARSGLIEANEEFSHKDDGRTEISGHKPGLGNQSPQRLSEMRAAASSAARENPRRSPRR
jgi:hypothetical protein